LVVFSDILSFMTTEEKTQNPAFVRVTVEVPIDRHGEFHEIVGRWLGGTLNRVDATGWRDGRPWLADDHADARAFYKAVSPRARKVLALWASRQGKWVTGEETARRVGVNGPKGVAGTLSSVGTTANKLKKQLPFEHQDGPAGASGLYRMTPTVAALFAAAQDEEGK
jgi:hypothetical protein